MLMVTKARFDGLSATEREKLAQPHLDSAVEITHIPNSREDGLTQKFRKESMVITSGTPQQARLITDRMRSYWPKWASRNEPAAEKALEVVKHAMGLGK